MASEPISSIRRLTRRQRPGTANGAHNANVQDILRTLIANNIVPAREKLPSERELQLACQASRGTVREALSQLEAQGLIYRMDRRGWFVSSPRIDYDPSSPLGFTEFVTEQGRKPRTETLDKNLVRCDAEKAAIFDKQVGEELYQIRRRRYVDDEPVLVEVIFVDPVKFRNLYRFDLDGSLQSVLSRHFGTKVASGEINMYATTLSGRTARDLYAASGTPCLFVQRINRAKDGSVVEYDQEYWRHNAFRLSLKVSG